MRHLIVFCLVVACSSSPPLPAVRFANAPPVAVVNDRQHVPEPPKPREFVRWLYAFDGQIFRPVTRALELKRHRRALGVNALDEVLQRYSGQVRFVHLDYPLEGHAEAVPAARAARCAAEQGKFWEYHRSLMARPGTLDPADLQGRASMLQLDQRRFTTCLASDKYDAAIEGELRHGMDLGVTGTPAYFVNGRMLSGARPFESFAELIDEELAAE